MGFIKDLRWVLLKGGYGFYYRVQMGFIKGCRWVLLKDADGFY